MKALLRPVAVFALVSALAVPAVAQTTTPRAELTLSQIESRLNERGFRVLEIERDDGRYEVKAISSAGDCVELDVDRRSGEIIRTKSDDDCGVANRSGARR